MPSGRNPQSLPRLRYNPADDGGVDLAVGEEGGHGSPTQAFVLLPVSASRIRRRSSTGGSALRRSSGIPSAVLYVATPIGFV